MKHDNHIHDVTPVPREPVGAGLILRKRWRPDIAGMDMGAPGLTHGDNLLAGLGKKA